MRRLAALLMLLALCPLACLAQDIIADAEQSGYDFIGTDNSGEIERFIAENALPPWGTGQGADLVLPEGYTGITRKIMLPSTFNDYHGGLVGGIRIRGAGSGASYLVYLEDSDRDKDAVIGWQYFEIDVAGYRKDETDCKTWVSLGDDPDNLINQVRTGSETKLIQVEILGGPYEGIHPALGRDFSQPHSVKIDAPYQPPDVWDITDYTIWADNFGNTYDPPGGPGDFNNDGVVDNSDYTVWADNFGKPKPIEPARLRSLCNATRQSISGLSMRLPRNEGAVGIRRNIWDEDHWETHGFSDYSWHQVGGQRLQLDLDDVVFMVDNQYNPACVRVEGSWLNSNLTNCKATGFYVTPWHYDAHLIWVDHKHPSGRAFPADVMHDGVGFQWSKITNCSGFNKAFFRGRAYNSHIAVGFHAGGKKSQDIEHDATTGLPCVWLQNSAIVTLNHMGQEGHQEIGQNPDEALLAETTIERSNGVMVSMVVGAGANVDANARDRRYGHGFLIKDSINCRVNDRIWPGGAYSMARRMQARHCSNPGVTAILRVENSRHSGGTNVNFGILVPAPGSGTLWETAEMQVGQAAQVDEFSRQHGCSIDGRYFVHSKPHDLGTKWNGAYRVDKAGLVLNDEQKDPVP